MCDRLERQLQLSATQMQRQHDAVDRYEDSQRRLHIAETTVQQLQADLQVSFVLLCDCYC